MVEAVCGICKAISLLYIKRERGKYNINRVVELMPIVNKFSLLNKHEFLNLHLQHAAIGSWPCFNTAAKPTNIFFTVFDHGSDQDSFITSTATGEKMVMQSGYCYFIPFNHLTTWKLSPEIRFVSIHFNLELFYGIDLFQNYPECVMWEAGSWMEEMQLLLSEHDNMSNIFRLNEIIYSVCRRMADKHDLAQCINLVTLERYTPVLRYVNLYGNAETRVEDLADIIQLRSNVFSRNFTRDLGITPKLFLVNTLVRKASDLLRRPDNSVRSVAEELKFSSEYYFSSFFKKNTGLPPKIFQQRNRLNNL